MRQGTPILLLGGALMAAVAGCADQPDTLAAPKDKPTSQTQPAAPVTPRFDLGGSAHLNITSKILDFGDNQTGVVSAQQTVNITNVGTSPIVMSGAGGAPPGNFNGVQDCQGQTLNPGDTCHMFFTFTPAAAGLDSSRSIGSWNGQPFNIQLKGNGVPPKFLIKTAAIDFGAATVGAAFAATWTTNSSSVRPNVARPVPDAPPAKPSKRRGKVAVTVAP